MLRFEQASKSVGSPSRLLSYKIIVRRDQDRGKARNVPVWSITGQYSQAEKKVGIVYCIYPEPESEVWWGC